MTLASNIEAMEVVLSNMQAQRDEALSTYVELSTDCSNLEAIIERARALKAPVNAEPVRDLPVGGLAKQLAFAEVSEHAGQPEPTEDLCSAAFPRDIDISGATSHLDRVRLLAERLPNRTFKVTDAAQWLIDLGVSNSTPDSLASALYGQFKGRADFRKTQPGYFQFVGYGEGAEIITFGVTAAG